MSVSPYPDPAPYYLGPWDRRQRRWMLAGSLYDGSFGVLMLAIPEIATRLLHVPYANPATDPHALWLRLNGIFLLVMATLYVLTARDPGRYLGIVGVCIAGKIVSIAFYVTNALTAWADYRMFLFFASLDAVFLAGHVWALGPNGAQRLRDAFRPARLPVSAAATSAVAPAVASPTA